MDAIAWSAVVTALATVAIAFLTHQTKILAERSLKVTAEVVAMNQKLAWFTGAMETHSQIMLRIEAARGVNGKPVETVYWDPTIEPPPVTPKHKQAAQLGPIYMFLPVSLREGFEKKA